MNYAFCNQEKSRTGAKLTKDVRQSAHFGTETALKNALKRAVARVFGVVLHAGRGSACRRMRYRALPDVDEMRGVKAAIATALS